MDVSGAIDIICNEIRTFVSPPSTLASLQFENHLYGCLSVLEMLAEDVSGIADLSANFSGVGHEFGFFHDERSIHDGWSNLYRDTWLWIWQTVGRERRDMSGVEWIESALIGQINDVSGVSAGACTGISAGACTSTPFSFFKVALESGDIPDKLYDECTELMESMKVPAKKRLRGTELTRRVHGRRAITPLRKRGLSEDVVCKRFRKTRKQ